MKAIVLKDNKRFLRKTQIDLPYYSDRDECFESVEEAKKIMSGTFNFVLRDKMISEAEVADKFFAIVYSQPKDTFFYTAFTYLEDAREYAKTLPRAEEFIKIYDEKGKEYELDSLKEFDFYDDNENDL